MVEKLKIACIADDSKKAQTAYEALAKQMEFVDLKKKRGKADVIVCLGGDGFILETLHKYMHRHIPVYGMNCGTVGFLLNEFRTDNLIERIVNARPSTLYPLSMYTRTVDGKEKHQLAINEVSLFRESRQAAKIRVSIDHVVRLEELVADGILVATPAGSTAYNFSVGGPIIPLNGNLLAMTPIGPFRPRRWRGAQVHQDASIVFEILEPEKRPVSAVADFTEIRDVASVHINVDTSIKLTLLFDPEHNLEERILKEQFVY
ncbi:MAG: NAD kinase [Rickettsiales bacterium]|nr:NAD kinase [Rickettsiales bacterium]|tara:strand:- start:815 stop:1597 length:783 start_codon:yes stop_codon:yes gene_type:complete